MSQKINELFEQATVFPDFEYQDRLNQLVGLDGYKSRLIKILSLLVNPNGIEKWAKKYHPKAKKSLSAVLRRPPLIVLEGDVGSGKTELASTIGDALARQEKIEVTLLPLSLSTRGQGHVGEMTKLLSNAFDHTITEAKKLKNRSGNSRGALILLVDEADALAQSRENAQMHHEDKAGVNAFIRGVDRIGNGKLPAAVIMCTNRLSALDPAIKRRAADILKFSRPSQEQRVAVLTEPLAELGISKKICQEIAQLTGAKNGTDYGFTFSDLTQRLLPAIVLSAYPASAVTANGAVAIAKGMVATPPFIDEN